MKTVKTKKAIAMLELIFSIAVMGIVLLSVPMIMQVTSKTSYVGIQQESINEAASQLYIIMSSYAWDENNSNINSETNPILRVSHGNPDLDEYGNTGRRAGTPSSQGASRSFLRPDGTTLNASTTLDIDNNDNSIEDDIDDFNGLNSLIEIEAASIDYVERSSASININVNYINDNISGGSYLDPGTDGKIVFVPGNSITPTTNIKRINVTLTSTSGVDELNKSIMLYGFSCNIGERTIDERWF